MQGVLWFLVDPKVGFSLPVISQSVHSVYRASTSSWKLRQFTHIFTSTLFRKHKIILMAWKKCCRLFGVKVRREFLWIFVAASRARSFFWCLPIESRHIIRNADSERARWWWKASSVNIWNLISVPSTHNRAWAFREKIFLEKNRHWWSEGGSSLRCFVRSCACLNSKYCFNISYSYYCKILIPFHTQQRTVRANFRRFGECGGNCCDLSRTLKNWKTS